MFNGKLHRLYWDIQEQYVMIYNGEPPPSYALTAQLIWREFFYCMSANNPKVRFIFRWALFFYFFKEENHPTYTEKLEQSCHTYTETRRN